MIAFHGKPEIKEKYVARVRAHRAADELIKGQYWENGKGCAVGCTIHGNTHKRYEEELGIPEIIAYLEDYLFERLPNELSMTWPERFLEAIPVGKDLSLVWPKFAVWLLVDPKDGVRQCTGSDKGREAIQNVADFYSKVIRGEEVSIEAWKEVTKKAWAAAADAAASAAYAAVVAVVAARARAYVVQAEKLLDLLGE